MKVIFLGTPEFAVPTLRRLVRGPHTVELVVSRPDRPVGRHQELATPPVAELARKLRLPLVQPKSLKEKSLASELSATGADIGVVVAYGKLIPPSLLKALSRGFVNLHPSLLPRHRGPSPVQWALACGDRTTGVTTMLLDEGMDTGPVLLQKRVDIEPAETAEMLACRLAEIGADLVMQTLDGLQAGTVEPTPQPTTGVNVTPMLRRSFGKVDWTMPARQLARAVHEVPRRPAQDPRPRGGPPAAGRQRGAGYRSVGRRARHCRPLRPRYSSPHHRTAAGGTPPDARRRLPHRGAGGFR